MTPEFSRPVRIDTLGPVARSIEIEAGEEERAALAERFDLIAIDSLAARLALSRSGEAITAKGTVIAAVTQRCVATGLPVPAKVEESFALLLRPEPAAGSEEEIELSEGEMDVVFYEGGLIDAGEIAAETLSLGLDPYPRSAEADEALRSAGVRSETAMEAERAEERARRSPFAALRRK
jgi:uncharacterized metal-binding protein YceD (DUF177 family)